MSLTNTIQVITTMTKIYIYCLFDDTRGEVLKGVYSSIKAVHRDALRLANRGESRVYMVYNNKALEATVGNLRNTLKGKVDESVSYRTNRSLVRVYKTKLK